MSVSGIDPVPSCMWVGYNGYVLYHEKRRDSDVGVVRWIPAAWNERGWNLLEIRNTGLEDICIDKF